MVLVALRNVFQMRQKLVNDLGLRKQVLIIQIVVELTQSVFDFLGQLFVDMPAMAEFLVFLELAEWLADHQQEKDVVLQALVLGDVAEKIILDDDAAQRVEQALHLAESGLLLLVFFGLPHHGKGVSFDLTDALAGDAIELADGVQGHTLGLLAETIAMDDDVASPIRQRREKPLRSLFGFE